VVATAGTSQSFTAGLDYKDFGQDIQLDPEAVLKTPIKYINASINYSGAWRGKTQQFGFDTTANFGVRDGVDNSDQFPLKRYKGHGNYFYLRSGANYGIHLPHDFTVLVQLNGQYGPNALISNEQFTIGGAASVRGYLEAEEIGDFGVKGTLQFGTPQLVLAGERLHLDGFIFFDAARASVNDNDPNLELANNTALRSYGLGVNLSFTDHLSGVFTWAEPLLDASHTRAHDSRYLFSVRGSW
jgi:hemolysin activation/secretion protein